MIRKFSLATAVLVAASASAFAADLPSRRPPPVFTPVPLFTWTGFYVGADVGYAWGYNDSHVPILDGTPGTLSTFSSKPNGELGGLHIGYNYQINQFVVGLEGDVVGSNFNNTGTLFSFAGVPIITTSTRIPVEGSVRGRLGYAWDRALFYVTGGAAFGDIEHQYSIPLAGITDPSNPYRQTRVGYTIGGGVEYALSNNWSVRGEYRYTDYGHTTNTTFATLVPGGIAVDNRVQEHRVTVGFSYKFDMYAPPAPIVAKY